MTDDLPAVKPVEILLVVDTIIPTLRKYLKKSPLNKKGLLAYTKDKKGRTTKVNIFQFCILISFTTKYISL